MAKAVGEIKACGARYTATFDWTAYDAVDWSKTGKSKQEWLGYEKGTLESLGDGVDLVCADRDCKAVLGGVDTIVYRITDDNRQRLSAKIDGKTLVFTNYTFGSTRFVSDFENATRSACEAAALPAGPAAPTKQRTNAPAKPAVVTPPAGNAPAKAAPASAAWDATYRLIPPAYGGFCPEPEGLGVLKVASGKLSLPWITAPDWEPTHGSKSMRVGHVDGIVHADGTAVATATFDAPIWQSMTVWRVKVKRQLDSASVKMRFSRDTDGTKLLALEVTLPGQTCNFKWESGRPKPPPVTATRKRPSPSPSPDNDEGTPKHEEPPPPEKDPCEGLPTYNKNTKYDSGAVVRADLYWASKWRVFKCDSTMCDSPMVPSENGGGWHGGDYCSNWTYPPP